MDDIRSNLRSIVLEKKGVKDPEKFNHELIDFNEPEDFTWAYYEHAQIEKHENGDDSNV